MTRPRIVVAIAVWLVVVIGVSTLVWAVISRAGDELAAPQRPLVATTGDAGRAPFPTADRSPTVVRRTWQGAGGLVIAACDGPIIRLASAQPVDGFHATVKKDGPDELEVELEHKGERCGTDVTVVARCLSGTPAFAVRVEGD
jgi:putative intracellular protease/amidase